MPSSTSQRAIYSLLTVIVVLLVGIMALLQVADRRHQRLEDEAQDLRQTIARQKRRIDDLTQQLRVSRAATTAPIDSLPGAVSGNDSLRVFKRL
ncbi:hypothetical protein HNV11_19595 [Spirosoma taeanense]|uniref:Uncharacterized protein n=1 Tax=Spirosoma taeanense TaxID=2735870 RepID=A0A6M5YCT3_9BACT|nr:hypothetical protein [Spirosoma taeanense]QJW91424.1 hypothetical protein HNV11_19595 [Spirosoma taeanense]